MARIFHIGFAQAEVEGLFGAVSSTYLAALEESWIPGTEITRYGRTWRISRPHQRRGRVWTGRIGFIREGDIRTVGWDPEELDFETSEAAGGVIVPFAIDVAMHAVGFQLRGGVIRPTTFTGAFQALLNQRRVYRWLVQPLVKETSFESWRESVARVTDARFRLERPNPDWTDREEVERIIEDLDAEIARLEARAQQGLNTEGPIFRQALDHVLRNYGKGVLRGVDEREVESEWHSSEGGAVPMKAEIESEAETEEIPEDDLTETLESRDDELRELSTGRLEEDDES